jgi:hypothetical protein
MILGAKVKVIHQPLPIIGMSRWRHAPFDQSIVVTELDFSREGFQKILSALGALKETSDAMRILYNINFVYLSG